METLNAKYSTVQCARKEIRIRIRIRMKEEAEKERIPITQ
jgi:hypothetical protein